MVAEALAHKPGAHMTFPDPSKIGSAGIPHHAAGDVVSVSLTERFKLTSSDDE